MTFDEIETKVSTTGLSVVGAFHPEATDGVDEAIKTLILLGPKGPEMWWNFSASAEYSDGTPNPLDRWSERVIGALAEEFVAIAVFPFGGPPWQPFQKWAARGENAVSSPVSMQVTQGRGLWASYRGALGLNQRVDLPEQSTMSPCKDCEAPCLNACPVDAFAGGSYDVPRCTAHLKSAEGTACKTGCLVRTACPYGQRIKLPIAQRAFHIDAFLRANG